jgi:pimeloyl-ACP methyl ester carboxylesterase
MSALSEVPEARYYQSQGLRLHFSDWGNRSAPPLLLVHGGLDQSRSWDRIAQGLKNSFHVMAPDLRGHGDSDWAKGSSYSLADHIYDLECLARFAGLENVTIVGHSMGGMVALAYAGTYPEKVSRLVVLDGVTVFPGAAIKPIEVRVGEWVNDLHRIAERKIRQFPAIADGAERMSGRNRRLTPEQALHLATHALRRNTGGGYSWKFDPYLRARAPYRLSPQDHAALWSRIQSPTLLVSGSESFLPDPEAAGVLGHFRHAKLVKIEGAGHWLHHDKADEVLDILQAFLEPLAGKASPA